MLFGSLMYSSLDEGGVFKAKGKRQKAQEVKEDRNVKEEVPIDKRRAKVVKVY